MTPIEGVSPSPSAQTVGPSALPPRPGVRAGLRTHMRQKLVAGALAAVPLAVTAFILFYVDAQVRGFFPGLRYPFVGIAVAVVAIYVLGVFVTSLLGRWVLGITDRALERVPGMRDLYVTWKQIALLPGGGQGMFSRVVLIPDESGHLRMLGLSTGQGVAGAPEALCVYVPGAPNPATGRLFFVAARDCHEVDVGAQEALKFALSGGNYVPAALGPALATSLARSPHRPAAPGHAGGPAGIINAPDV